MRKEGRENIRAQPESEFLETPGVLAGVD